MALLDLYLVGHKSEKSGSLGVESLGVERRYGEYRDGTVVWENSIKPSSAVRCIAKSLPSIPSTGRFFALSPYSLCDPSASVPSVFIRVQSGGRSDRYLGIDLARHAADRAPRIRTVYLDASHWVHEEVPAEVSSLLIDFIRTSR